MDFLSPNFANSKIPRQSNMFANDVIFYDPCVTLGQYLPNVPLEKAKGFWPQILLRFL